MVFPSCYQPVVDRSHPCRPQRVLGHPEDDTDGGKKKARLVRQLAAALSGARAAGYAGSKVKDLTRAVVQTVARKTAYRLYTYFYKDPANPYVSISNQLKLKISRWGFKLEEFHVKVRCSSKTIITLIAPEWFLSLTLKVTRETFATPCAPY